MESLNIQLQPFFEWLLRTTLQASVLIALILLVQLMLRGKLGIRWCYCLWLVLLIRMAMPWAPQSRVSMFNLIPQSVPQRYTKYAPEEVTYKSTEPNVVEMGKGESAAVSTARVSQDTSKTVPATPVIRREAADQLKLGPFEVANVLPLLWLTGALILAVYVCAGNFNLWRLVTRERPLTDQDILDLLEDCKSQMGIRTIMGVVITDKVKSPALFGFIRPRLLLPAGMIETLSREELRYVFLHELAHLKRHDIYVGYLSSLLQVLHWFNPLIWLAFYRMRADRELACDALVLARTQSGQAKDYGRTIVSLLERFSRSQRLPAMAGILETKTQLKRRIKMIARFKKNSYQWSPLAVILIILLACVSLLDARRTKASETSAAPPAGANIIWVSSTRDYDVDGVQDDQAWIDWLVAEGYNVDVRIDYWKELDAAKVDELNAADLVIISRSTYDHDHSDGNEPTLWNSVTTPLITMNSWLVNSNRWRWINTTDWVRRDHIMMALDTTHPVFDGVTFETGNLVIFLDNTVGSGQATFVGSIDVGNGTLIAQTLADFTWIAEWPAGVEFYAGSGHIAGGRRMLFTAGTQQRDGSPPTPWGAWNLTAEGEKMFRNAINYMLPAAPIEPPVEPPAGANIIWVTSTRDYDLDGVQDDQGFIDWLVAEGHNVDVRIDYWKELDVAKVDELNAADLVIMSRSTYSHDHSDGNETTLWNSVTTPLITMNSWVVRSNHWHWMDTTDAVWRDRIMLALYTTHPVFDGVTFEMGNLVTFLDNTVGSGQATFVGSIDVGNGTLIAQTLDDHTCIAEWSAGVEFYAGSGHIAGGRRMLFTAGTQERDGPPPTPWGAWNLTAEGEKMFRNAIAYMRPAAPEAPGPVAHWQLDEGSGTIAADSSGNGLDGMLVGDPLWVAGIIGGALEFDGVDDYVNIDGWKGICIDPADPNSLQPAFSISCWFKTTGNGELVTWGTDSGGQRLSYRINNGRIRTEHGSGNLQGDITCNDDAWHHFALTVMEGAAILTPETLIWLDGAVDVRASTDGDTDTYNLTPGDDVSIGRRSVRDDRYFPGTIDDVRIYDYALSEAEIAALASGQ